VCGVCNLLLLFVFSFRNFNRLSYSHLFAIPSLYCGYRGTVWFHAVYPTKQATISGLSSFSSSVDINTFQSLQTSNTVYLKRKRKHIIKWQFTLTVCSYLRSKRKTQTVLRMPHMVSNYQKSIKSMKNISIFKSSIRKIKHKKFYFTETISSERNKA